MKEAERKRARPMNEQDAKDAKLLAGFGFDAKTIGEKLGFSESTIIKLSRDDYDLEKYLARKKEENRKASEKKTTVELVYDPSIAEEYRREQEAKQAEEQVPGQIEMELPQKPEMSDQTKMMRFLASQMDRLYMKLETINDTLSQILRVVRKE